MAFYVSAHALLSDVRLRLDGLGDKSTALIVEGFDDKRLFYHRMSATAEVVPSGGKRLLRAGLGAMISADKGRMLFLTDCDYDVLGGTLCGGPDVVITSSCDVESDLIGLGVLTKIVVEVVPGVVETKERAVKVAGDVCACAQSLARPLGRIRIAAQPFGVDLDLSNLDFAKYWDKASRSPMVDKLHTSIFTRLRNAGVGISKSGWEDLIAETPDESIVCNGKDLIQAAQMILRTHYKMSHKVSADMMTSMIRLSLDERHFEAWPVVQRIRAWEKKSGRILLVPAA
jgi:hypothetical protein